MSSLTIDVNLKEHEKLGLLLKHHNITRPEIALIIGISLTSVSNYLSGRNAKRSQVPVKIKEYFSLPATEQGARLDAARLILNH